MPEASIVTWLLIAASVAVSLRGFQALRTGRDSERFLFAPYEVAQGRQRLGALLAGFAHADGGHLAFNMVTLFFFGPVVEAAFGPLGMLAIYVGSELGGKLLTFEANKRDPGYRSLGASGAISGVLFAAIVVAPSMGVGVIFLPIAIPAPLFAVGYVVGSIVGAQRRLGNIGHHAHLGGALTGFVLAGLLLPEGMGRLAEAVRSLVH